MLRHLEFEFCTTAASRSIEHVQQKLGPARPLQICNMTALGVSMYTPSLSADACSPTACGALLQWTALGTLRACAARRCTGITMRYGCNTSSSNAFGRLQYRCWMGAYRACIIAFFKQMYPCANHAETLRLCLTYPDCTQTNAI